MENILEDQRMILYRGFFSGVDYEVRVDKKSGVGTIIVPNGILSHPNYKSLYLNCYRRTLTNLTTLKNIAVSLEPTNELERERCKELMKTLPLDSEVEIVSKNKKEVNIENYLKANMITKNDNGTVGLGSTVSIKYIDDDDEDEYEIVGSQEADPFENKISNESPIGIALLKHKNGDIVDVASPNGGYTIKIVKIA